MSIFDVRHRARLLLRQYHKEILVGVLVYLALVFRDLLSTVLR